MSNSDWTPGPWMAAAKPSSIIGWPVVAPHSMGRSVCSVTHGHDEGAANAHLIAAAPELYEALAAIVADWDNKQGPTETIGALIKRARAALAKARGSDANV